MKRGYKYRGEGKKKGSRKEGRDRKEKTTKTKMNGRRKLVQSGGKDRFLERRQGMRKMRGRAC